jgi:[acyl-carrier-protein] S-malonyltransferase
MRAFVFPGQGSQKVGMGVELAEASAIAREVFEEVDDALGQKLFQIMREGPEDALTLTENAQPAIMANAIAALRVLEKEGGIALADKADFVAGHSLGEYTALCAAGAFSLADTARSLAARAFDAGGGASGRGRDGRAAGRRYREGDGAGRSGGRRRGLHGRQ